MTAEPILHESTGIAALGLDWKLFISQVVNFLLLLWILKAFAYKPIIAILEERRQRIARSLETARAIEYEKQKLEEKIQRQYDEAQLKAELIINQAKQSGDALKHQLIEEIDLKRQYLTKQLNQEVASLKEESIQEAKQELASLVSQISGDVLQKVMTDDLNKKITLEASKKI